NTPTHTPTITPTNTPTRTPTRTNTPTETPTPTATECTGLCLIDVCTADPNGTYVDAEAPSGTVNSGATYRFAGVGSSQAGFIGAGYLASGTTTQNQLDFTDVNTSSSNYERYDYTIIFPGAGTYKVWVRGYALDANSDSIFFGLNGTAI